MKWLNGYRKRVVLVGFVAVALLAKAAVSSDSQGVPPIADAGSSRYAAQDPVVLDGTGSYDPDNSGTLSYAWRQIAGPPAIIIDANTATPTVCGSMVPTSGKDPTPMPGGFPQTDEVQKCEFELVVNDGELTSLPDTVKVTIVTDFGANELVLENDSFDPNKPTFIYFTGGDCVVGNSGQPWNRSTWESRANVISFPNGYSPDSSEGARTYYKYGDMIIAYLSSVAPDYKRRIQTSGFSTGGQPAIDVGIHMNLIYADARYAVNRVTLIDVTSICRNYSASIITFLASAVDGEQCWVDSYLGTIEPDNYYPNILNVGSLLPHSGVRNWYRDSLTGSNTSKFDNGVVAGAYWSVVGPGKNLQLASTPGVETYKFTWYGDQFSGYMDYYDESYHPGRLPEPVTLMAWRDTLDPNGIVFTCKESENVVGYELLFGPDPYRVMDYNIVTDTPIPPCEVITSFPFKETWWTIRARDQHGSIIYADPIRIDLESLPWPTIENLTTGQTYGCIQAAIDHALPGDEILISPGTYQENIDLEGKYLTLTSINPNDPTTVSATVINGAGQCPVVSLSRCQGTGCVLDGLTITGGTIGIFCGDASPTISNCTIESTGPNGIEFLYGYEPIIIDCTILGPITEVYDPRLVALWKLDETEGSIASDSIGVNDGICHGEPLWQPAGGKLAGALEFDGIDNYVSTPFIISPADGDFSVFAWIKGGAAGHVILSQVGGVNWLMADAIDGTLRTDLKEPGMSGRDPKPPGPPLTSSTIVTNGDWHRVGFVRDGSYRTLYFDDNAVAEDTQDSLEYSDGGLYLGCGRAMEPGSFWSGLIDDVRIYNRAIKP